MSTSGPLRLGSFWLPGKSAALCSRTSAPQQGLRAGVQPAPTIWYAPVTPKATPDGSAGLGPTNLDPWLPQSSLFPEPLLPFIARAPKNTIHNDPRQGSNCLHCLCPMVSDYLRALLITETAGDKVSLMNAYVALGQAPCPNRVILSKHSFSSLAKNP